MTGPDAARTRGDKNALLPMRLFWSSRSPFVRKTMIAIHELGLADRVTTTAVVVTGHHPVPELEEINPLGQIPTLILADGTIIYDSGLICDFLDATFGGRTLIPAEYPRRLDVLQRTALAQGIKEKSIRWLHERFRAVERQDPKVLAGHHRSIGLCLDACEADVGRWGPLPVDLGHIGLAAALCYLDFRFGDAEWRKGRPLLTAWHAEFSERASVQATAFIDTMPRPEPAAKA